MHAFQQDMVLAITLPSHLEKLQNSVCKFSKTTKHRMLNKSFTSLKLDAQCVIHNNPIHTVNVNITLAFKKRWQPLKIVCLFSFCAKPCPNTVTETQPLVPWCLWCPCSRHNRDGRAGRHRETICSYPFVFLVEHTMKRCPKVKEPPDASKPTLAALAMSHVALWLQLPAPPTLTGIITAMASCVLHASLLAATSPSCSRQRNPFSPISTLAPLALKAFPYCLWLKFHLLGLGFHCV